METGIYLWHNLVNGKQYVDSGYKLSDRLAEYYHPSKLSDNRYIYNSISKYGHDNFSYYWVMWLVQQVLLLKRII